MVGQNLSPSAECLAFDQKTSSAYLDGINILCLYTKMWGRFAVSSLRGSHEALRVYWDKTAVLVNALPVWTTVL